MHTATRYLLSRLARICWMPRFALSVTLGFFVAAGLAHARIAVTRSILPAVLFHSFPYDARGPPLTA
jgi:hypothetical protein